MPDHVDRSSLFLLLLWNDGVAYRKVRLAYGAIMQSILGALLTAAAARGYNAGARKGAPYRGICTHAG